jgi:hypothetical protein
MRISIHSTTFSKTPAKTPVVTVRLKITLNSGFRRGSSKFGIGLDKKGRHREEKETNVERNHFCLFDLGMFELKVGVSVGVVLWKVAVALVVVVVTFDECFCVE